MLLRQLSLFFARVHPTRPPSIREGRRAGGRLPVC